MKYVPPAGGPWVDLLWLVRLFWACRVSVFSAFAGIVLFAEAIPAQNLMADLSYADPWWLNILFWFGVFLATFLMWAFPVHYVARLALSDRSWILQANVVRSLDWECRDAVERAVQRRFAGWTQWLPRVLGLVPFAALGMGIGLGAHADFGARALPVGSQTIAQAWCLGAADLATALLFLVFVIVRRRWTRHMTFSSRGFHWLRRFSVLAWVVTSIYFLLSYFAPIFTSVWTPRALLVPPLFGCSVLGLGALGRYGHRTGTPVFLLLAVVAVVLTALNAPFNDLRKLPIAKPADGRLSIEAAVTLWKVANGCDAPSAVCPHPVVVAIDGGASRAAFTAATFVGDLLDRIQVLPLAKGEARTPGRRLFAISGVSGGAYGAAVIQAALADAQTDDPLAAVRTPCRSAERTWFRHAEQSGEIFDWRDCLQALTSGDYLSTTIIGLAFRDGFAPPGLPIGDRATLLEQSFERHYDRTVRVGSHAFDGGAVCDGPAETGLCRPIAHPADYLARHKGGWIPLLMLNGTSVETGRRIISADLASSRSPPKVLPPDRRGGPLYTEAYDLREAMSSKCPSSGKQVELGIDYVDDLLAQASGEHSTQTTRTHGICAAAEPLDGPDIRLSTAAVVSARFPVISPAGAFMMKDGGYGDQVVDGGYFENTGITTALDVVDAIEAYGLKPILVSIGNDPQTDKRNAGLPRRPSTTPLLPRSGDTLLWRSLALIRVPLDTLLATRDGHADEALHQAQEHFNPTGFYRFRVDQAPKFDPADQDPRCREIREKVAGKTLTMTDVSMSWWLSAAVQADLDAQRCSIDNREATRAIMAMEKMPPSP